MVMLWGGGGGGGGAQCSAKIWFKGLHYLWWQFCIFLLSLVVAECFRNHVDNLQYIMLNAHTLNWQFQNAIIFLLAVRMDYKQMAKCPRISQVVSSIHYQAYRSCHQTPPAKY